MKYKITIQISVDVPDMESAQDVANSINVYRSIEKGGNELNPSFIDVQRVNDEVEQDETLNLMSTDQVLDNSIKEFVIASYSLTNSLDQVHVTV